RQVNVASPSTWAGPGPGYITTNWYDQFGNAVQSLTAHDRINAFDPGMLGWYNTTTADLAYDLSTINIYNTDGTYEISTAGPYHGLTTDNGTWVLGRDVTTNTPDEGAPAGTCPCGLTT